MLRHLNVPLHIDFVPVWDGCTRTDRVRSVNAMRPSVSATSWFLAACQGIHKSTGRTGLIYRHFRLFGRHFTFSTVTSVPPPVTLIGSMNIKPGKSCQVLRTPLTWYLAPMARWSEERRRNCTNVVYQDFVSTWDLTDCTVWVESPILYLFSDRYLPFRTPAEQPHSINCPKTAIDFQEDSIVYLALCLQLPA